MRGEPVPKSYKIVEDDDFNSLAPCGANPRRADTSTNSYRFQLTRPVRGEPRSPALLPIFWAISTHSSRAGRTFKGVFLCGKSGNFNSLAPCGANPLWKVYILPSENFNSLAPCGANHGGEVDFLNFSTISTHSPRAGRTTNSSQSRRVQRHFNSLAPCGANRVQLPNR